MNLNAWEHKRFDCWFLPSQKNNLHSISICIHCVRHILSHYLTNAMYTGTLWCKFHNHIISFLHVCTACLCLPVVSLLVFDSRYLLNLHLKRRVSWVIPHPVAHFHLIMEASRLFLYGRVFGDFWFRRECFVFSVMFYCLEFILKKMITVLHFLNMTHLFRTCRWKTLSRRTAWSTLHLIINKIQLIIWGTLGHVPLYTTYLCPNMPHI